MAIKASDLAVKALKPRAGGKYEAGVAGYRGLVVIVYPSGRKAWTFRTRKDGQLYREHIGDYGPGDTGMGLAVALKRYIDLRGERRQGVDLAAKRQRRTQQERQAPTVKALAKDYMERHAKPNKRTWRADEAMLERDVIPAWGRLKAESIDRADVVKLLDAITDRKAPMQAGKVLALVRKVWNFGIERGALASNPAAKIPRPAKMRAKDRVLSDEELRAFWLKLPDSGIRPQVAGALRLQLLTGQRIGEALKVELSELDTKAKTWLIPASKAKNGREHLVPLSTAALEGLESQPEGSEHIFPADRGENAIRSEVAAHELAEALPKLKVAKFTTHDLRRTVATRMASLGIPKEIRDRVLNHTDRTVGGVHYDRHDYLAEKRAALDKWAALLAEIIEGRNEPTNVLPLRKKARA